MRKRSLWPVIAAVALGGCLCSDTRTTEAAFAPMESYRLEIAACLTSHACGALCADLFQIDGDADIESCTIASLVRQDATTQAGLIGPQTDLRQFRGANVRVTYVTHASCDDDWIDGWDDGWTDDGSTDDGSTDDGWDDGSSDDGSSDDGSSDDGSSDDGSGDDGWGDDGWGDDGSG